MSARSDGKLGKFDGFLLYLEKDWLGPDYFDM